MSKGIESVVRGCTDKGAANIARRLLRDELTVLIAKELDSGRKTPQELRDLSAALRHLDAMDV